MAWLRTRARVRGKGSGAVGQEQEGHVEGQVEGQREEEYVLSTGVVVVNFQYHGI